MERRSFITASSALLLMPKLFAAEKVNQNTFSKELIYSNDLTSENDIKNFKLEGEAFISFENSSMRMKNALDPSLKQKSNFVNWCDLEFPENISIEWEFKPIEEPGLAIMFFAAKGINGESIFGKSIKKRDGVYEKYHSGDINTYHISYFRRKHLKERAFQTCNLRRSKGFKLCTIGADPIPSTSDVIDFYRIKITKFYGHIIFTINDLKIFEYNDLNYFGSGRIGFRQMAPLSAEYKNLKIFELIRG
jgi:hypothetical protein